MCRTPKMADVVTQTLPVRQETQRESALVESRKRDVLHTDEEDNNAEEEVSCFKEAVANSNRQLDVSGQQQRDVAVIMGDTPSPAPSVISILSEPTDEEEDGQDEDAHRCHLRE